MVRSEVIRQLVDMILAGPFQLNYAMLCYAVFLVYSNVWDSGIRTEECQKILSKFYYLKVMNGIHKTNILAFSNFCFTMIVIKDFLRSHPVQFYFQIESENIQFMFFLLQDTSGAIWKLDLTFSNMVILIFLSSDFFSSFVIGTISCYIL